MTYTLRVLSQSAIHGGHKVVNDPAAADIIGLTLPSYDGFFSLRTAKKKYKGKPIIVGGQGTNSPLPITNYADFVHLGHGFEIFRDIRNIEDLSDYKSIITKEKTNAEYSQYIDWEILPISKISKQKYTYILSYGCKRKCSYCVVSWTLKHEKNRDSKIKRVVDKYGRKIKLIYNYAEKQEGMLYGSYILDDMYKTIDNIKKAMLIRIGVESVTKEGQKLTKKKIDYDKVRYVVQRCGEKGIRMSIFLLAGIGTQEEWEDFISFIFPKKNTKPTPPVYIIVNWLVPSLGTPLYRLDLRTLKPVNTKDLFYKKAHWDARIRIPRAQETPYKIPTFYTLAQRTIEKAKLENLYKISQKIDKEKTKDYYRMLDYLESEGFGEEINGTFDYPANIINWHKKDFWNGKINRKGMV